MRTFSILPLLLAVASGFAGAQQCTTSVAVNAFDARTKAAIHGLTPADFSARLNHSKLDVVSVEPVFRNRVLMLLDASGGNAASLNAVADLVREAPPGMPVAFGVFAEHTVLSRGFVSDSDQLNQAIDGVVARAAHIGTRSAIANSLTQSLQLFGAHRPGDTIVLISSGHAHLSEQNVRALKNELRRHGTRLQLLFGLLPAAASSQDGAAQIFSPWNVAVSFDSALIRLAKSTGGVLMGFMNSEWTEVATSGYMLSLNVPANVHRGDNWSLQMRAAGNDVPPADLFYPEQLAPCTLTQVADAGSKTKPRP